MKKVVIFKKKKKLWAESPDIELLNIKILEIENDGWTILSINTNTNFIGGITSYTIIIESSE